MANNEKHTIKSHESSKNIEQFGAIAHERNEAIRETIEKAEKEQRNHNISEREVLARARELADKNQAETEQPQSPAEKRRGPITKKQLNDSFKSQMKYAETEMTGAERLVSRFIHLKPIDKSADVIGSTIARPNSMLSGSIAAFLSITILYFVSKHYGYPLSGFETAGAFIAGWVVGLMYDQLVKLFKREQ